jgi:hypothetical protein
MFTSFNHSPFSRVRRNHALEHATLQVLSKRDPHLSLAGSSDLGGFWVLGDVDTQDLQESVDEALERLRAGERQLAIHPNCGTNFAAAGLLAGGAAWLGMVGSGGDLRKKVERLPLIISLVTMVLILGQPLGPILQARVTTQASVGDLAITGITRFQRRDMPVHRVTTRN